MSQVKTPAPAEAADPVLAELVEEITDRLQAGEAVDPEALAARHPDKAEELRRLLPALRMLATAGGSRDGPAPGANAAEVGDALEPRVLGDFRIVREVGRGGMGVVYEAEQVSLGRRVALKVLPFAATMDPRQLQRFRNEAQAAACLHHTNIVPVYFVGEAHGVHFYAMQFIDGRTVAAVIDELRRQENLTLAGSSPPGRDYFRTVARWGCEAAEALDHAHQVGVVHRDVKPANLLVDDADGKVWVTDFGLAQLGQGDAGLTLTGDLVGTLRYMSPEQALARRVVIDHRTDVYSLGATLYELLTLRPAFTGADRQELLRQVAFEEPVAPRRLRRSVPRELETVVLKAMEKSPADRYATAQELADDLRRWLEDRPIRARRPGLARRAVKWSRRHRPLVAAAVVSLLLAVLMLALSNFVIWRQREETREALRTSRLHRAEVDELATQLAQLRHGSEAELERSLRALDGTLAALDLGPDGPEVERVRRAAAGPALEYYRGLRPPQARLYPLRWELMWMHLRVGGLHALRDEFAEAKQAYLEASTAAEGLRHLLAVPRIGRGRPGGLFPPDFPDRPADEQGFRRALAHWRKVSPQTLGEVADYRVALAQSLPTRVVQVQTVLSGPRAGVQVPQLPPGEGPRTPADYPPRIAILERVVADLPTAAHRTGLVSMYAEYAADLARAGRRPEALRGYLQAVECGERWREDLPSGQNHHGLAQVLFQVVGDGLNRLKEPAEAGRAFRACLDVREALVREKALSPSDRLFVRARLALVEALRAQGPAREGTAPEEARLLDEAIAECREALRRQPGDPQAQPLLPRLLLEKGEPDEAVAAYREALRLGGHCDTGYLGLGLLLAEQGRLDEVVALYREAVRLNPGAPVCHTRLGLALQGRGHFREAAAELRRGRPGDRDPTPTYAQQWAVVVNAGQPGAGAPGGPPAAWLRTAERLAETEARLPALLAGTVAPADAVEHLALALIWHQDRQLFGAAAREYAEAFAAEPALAAEPASGYRYGAARAAARAGCGQGKDAAGLDGPQRAGLRRQALDWLLADLAGWRQVLEAEPAPGRLAVLRATAHWLQDRAFAGVRGPSALARLPQAERRDWQRLWEEVEALSDWQRLWETGPRR